LLKAELPRYLANPDFKPAPQTITGRTESYSRKLTKADGVIDWKKPALQIEREIRAYQEWPTSKATIAGKDVAITAAKVIKKSGKPGLVAVDGNSLTINCAKDALQIISLKPAGKNQMTATSFINGHKDLLK